MFRFNPAAEKKFVIDSKAQTPSYRDFIMNEARYASLTRSFPERDEVLFTEAEAPPRKRYEHLLKLQALNPE